jgi:HSP20 family protein
VALDLFDELARELWDVHRRRLEPLANVRETEDRVIVEVDLPLVQKRGIAVTLVDAGLEIDAQFTRCVQFARWGTVQRNCEFTSFYKLVPLPCPVVAEGATTTFKRGMLRVELRKRRAAAYRLSID